MIVFHIGKMDEIVYHYLDESNLFEKSILEYFSEYDRPCMVSLNGQSVVSYEIKERILANDDDNPDRRRNTINKWIKEYSVIKDETGQVKWYHEGQSENIYEDKNMDSKFVKTLLETVDRAELETQIDTILKFPPDTIPQKYQDILHAYIKDGEWNKDALINLSNKPEEFLKLLSILTDLNVEDESLPTKFTR